jgi:hypothetical protein
MAWLTVKEAAEWLDISEAAVRKRIQRCTLAHRRSDGHVYVYRDANETADETPEGTSEEDAGTKNADGKQNEQRSWWDYIAGVSGLLVAIGGLIYVLGLFSLWAPLARSQTPDMVAAWQATSLVPKTVVAGLGLKQLVAFPLAFGLIIYVTLFLSDRSWRFLVSRFRAIRKRLRKRNNLPAGSEPEEHDDIEEYEPGWLYGGAVGIVAQAVIFGYSGWLILNTPGSLAASDVGFWVMFFLIAGAVIPVYLLCLTLFFLFAGVNYKWSLVSTVLAAWTGFWAYKIWEFWVVPSVKDLHEPDAIANALTTFALVTAAATIIFVGAIFVFFTTLGYLPNKEPNEEVGLYWWESLILMVACSFVAAFMFTITTKPPLATAQINTKNDEHVSGLLLVHAEGFWYIFESREGESKSTLRALHDDRVKAVLIPPPEDLKQSAE